MKLRPRLIAMIRKFGWGTLSATALIFGAASAWAAVSAPTTGICKEVLSKQVTVRSSKAWSQTLMEDLSFTFSKWTGDRAPDGSVVRNQAGMFSYRIGKDPELLRYFEGTPFWKNGQLQIGGDADAAALYEMIAKRIYERIPESERSEYILPGMIVGLTKEGKKRPVLSTWKLGSPPTGDLIGETIRSRFGEIDFLGWAEMIVHLRILPMSVGGTYHDFGHLLAVLRNPREELKYQRKFYEVFLENVEKIDNFENLEKLQKVQNLEKIRPPVDFLKYYYLMRESALLLFENMTLPKVKPLEEFFTRRKLDGYRASLAEFTSKRTGFIDANKVIRAESRAKKFGIDLGDFEERFLRSDSEFYSSIDAYGGAYHDTYHTLAPDPTTMSGGSTGSLENLYLKYKDIRSSAREKRDASIRLFSAFYNARVGSISFDRVYTDATSSWSSLPGTRSFRYFLSYGDNRFRKSFKDRFRE